MVKTLDKIVDDLPEFSSLPCIKCGSNLRVLRWEYDLTLEPFDIKIKSPKDYLKVICLNCNYTWHMKCKDYMTKENTCDKCGVKFGDTAEYIVNKLTGQKYHFQCPPKTSQLDIAISDEKEGNP